MTPLVPTLHWFSTWPADGTASALAAFEAEAAGSDVVAWHVPGSATPRGLTARPFDGDKGARRALNEGVAVFDLRGASSEHAWIVELATSVPGVVLVASPAWHALTRALPGGLARWLHLVHEEHGADGLDGARDLRTGHRSADELDVALPLAGWVARHSLAVLADLSDPRCAVRAELGVPVMALPPEPEAVVRAVASLAADVGALRRRAAANRSADHVGAIVRRWVVPPDAARATFDRASAALRSLYGADA